MNLIRGTVRTERKNNENCRDQNGTQSWIETLAMMIIALRALEHFDGRV